MTKTEIAVLKALDAAPTKTASWQDLRDASGVKTPVGFRRVISRMTDNNLVRRADLHGLDMTITFGGMRALQAAQ